MSHNLPSFGNAVSRSGHGFPSSRLPAIASKHKLHDRRALSVRTNSDIVANGGGTRLATDAVLGHLHGTMVAPVNVCCGLSDCACKSESRLGSEKLSNCMPCSGTVKAGWGASCCGFLSNSALCSCQGGNNLEGDLLRPFQCTLRCCRSGNRLRGECKHLHG